MTSLACEEFWFQIFNEGEFIPVLAIVLGCGVGAIAILAGSISAVLRTKAKEQTKRELAAYVASGSLSPDQAVAMLNAGTPKWEAPDGSTFQA